MGMTMKNPTVWDKNGPLRFVIFILVFTLTITLIFAFLRSSDSVDSMAKKGQTLSGSPNSSPQNLYPIVGYSPPEESSAELYPVETPTLVPQSTSMIPDFHSFTGITVDGSIVQQNIDVSSLLANLILQNGSLQGQPYIPEGLPVAPEVIIGPDGRYAVGNSNSDFPYSTVARINWVYYPGPVASWCTGWMVGRSTVITSAHCLYDAIKRPDNPWVYDVTAFPGYNIASNQAVPFGSCNFLDYFVPNLWILNGQPKEYDFGYIRLGCDIGNKSGYLGYTFFEGSGAGKFLQLIGFPQDKSFGNEMWLGLGSLLHSDELFTYYDNDTVGGNSGSPVWEIGYAACPSCVLAVHSREAIFGSENGGPRVADLLLAMLFQESYYVTRQIFLPLTIK